MKEVIVRGKKKRMIKPTRQIALSLLAVIFIGSLLLTLPIANNGTPARYLDHLFVATSATCVTGLVPYPTVDQYSLFGQIVILCLIQIGGLGFLTFMTLIYVKARKRLSFTSKLVVQEALNVNSLNNLSHFLRNIVIYTFLFEGIGALLLCSQFIPDYGLFKGLYMGVFHSISAFCNAGFDIIGASSLVPYQNNLIINFTICILIIMGGLGFCVWFDIANKIKEGFSFRKSAVRIFKSLELHSKLVLTTTVFLLISGTILVYLLEYKNPNTIGGMDGGYKLMGAFFQSTTLRTAGFATIDCAQLTVATKFIMCIYMFIGGSPAGTAGGVKTVTFAVIMITLKSLFKGDDNVNVFKRRIEIDFLKRSLCIFIFSLALVVVGLFCLTITEEQSFIDLCFEAFSGFATVGLTAGLTPSLSDVGKIVIIILMYIGRIGPITMMLSFMRKSQKNTGNMVFPKGEIIIG